MHILPLILAIWSYKQQVTDAYLKSLGGTSPQYLDHEQAPRLAVSSDGQLSLVPGNTGLMAPSEVEAIRNRKRDYFAGPPCPNPDGSNTVIGSHFGSNEITHNGTDAWRALKCRLAENGIFVDDDRVAELSAGFFAERKLQELTGRSDPARLRDEITARWVREIMANPDEDTIAAECFAELQQNFPRAIGADLTVANKAIGFDENTLEVE